MFLSLSFCVCVKERKGEKSTSVPWGGVVREQAHDTRRKAVIMQLYFKDSFSWGPPLSELVCWVMLWELWWVLSPSLLLPPPAIFLPVWCVARRVTAQPHVSLGQCSYRREVTSCVTQFSPSMRSYELWMWVRACLCALDQLLPEPQTPCMMDDEQSRSLF